MCRCVKGHFEKFFSQEPARLTKIVTSRRGGTTLSYRVLSTTRNSCHRREVTRSTDAQRHSWRLVAAGCTGMGHAPGRGTPHSAHLPHSAQPEQNGAQQQRQTGDDTVNTPQQNILTIEQITAALFGSPTFTSSLGDPFESKAPDGSGGKWLGRRVAQAIVPLLVNGVEVGINFSTTVYKDVSPDGESYAVRVSLPQGASKWQSAFSGDESLISALKFHIADHADRWLEQQAKTARPSSTNQPSQPRLVVRKIAKPEAAPVVVAPVEAPAPAAAPVVAPGGQAPAAPEDAKRRK